jgi:hypothetical protein
VQTLKTGWQYVIELIPDSDRKTYQEAGDELFHGTKPVRLENFLTFQDNGMVAINNWSRIVLFAVFSGIGFNLLLKFSIRFSSFSI